MKKTSERRRKKRWQVAVLVRCSIPKYGDEIVEMEMWAKDVNEEGMQLESSKGLTAALVEKKSKSEKDAKQVRFEDIEFSKGSALKVQDLFYDDDGSPFVEGKILWARHSSDGNWSLGVKFSDPKKQKALTGAFKDFLSIVKNPTIAIARATKKVSLRKK
ncbi:MAG: hypothetical protein ACKVQC_07215 [Elusimicrobiota bacterium]